MGQPLFFVHIPKTAGTSFRVALEGAFGKEHVCADYGSNSPDTSPVVKQLIYEKKDHIELSEVLSRGYKVLCGHVSAKKYANIIPVTNMVTLLRDPIKRVISEYRHFVRLNDYKQPFRQFYAAARNINVHSNFLKGVPINAIGFIGFVEDYGNSLNIFANTYRQELPSIFENVDPQAVANNLTVDEQDIEAIRTLNQQDLALYAHAHRLFEIRLALLKQGLPYTYADYYGTSHGDLQGWAFRLRRNGPLAVELLIEGKVAQCTLAQDYHQLMHSLGTPRKGHVGFSFKLKDGVPHTHFSVRIQDTRQMVLCSHI